MKMSGNKSGRAAKKRRNAERQTYIASVSFENWLCSWENIMSSKKLNKNKFSFSLCIH
jgi:hypothetical protein